MIVIPHEISGHFGVELYRQGELIRQVSFDNIMTSGGLNLIGNGTTLENAYAYLQVGTGNSTPNAADTSLESPLGSRSNQNAGFSSTTVFNTNPEYHNYRKTFFFEANQSNGELHELGIYNQSTGGVLVNRSLFRDAIGQIAPIVKTSEDTLIVRYDLRSYAPTEDITGSMMVSGSSVDYTIRASSVGTVSGWLAGTKLLGNFNTGINQKAFVHEPDTLVSRTSNLNTSPNSLVSSVSPRNYVNNTFYRDVLYTFSINSGNFGSGIGAFSVHPFTTGTESDRMFQIRFSPKIPKVFGKTFSITLRHTWRPRT